MDFFNQNVTRGISVALMDFFSRISIEKFQTVSVSGDSIFAQRKIVPVPIQWATREKFVEIIRSSSARKSMNPVDRERNPVEMQWILPRISCNLTGITYDPARKLIKTQQIDSIPNAEGTNRNATYSPAPYNLEFEIATISRSLDENLQIMEQILPYFSPTMSMTLKLYADKEPLSIPFTLNSVSIDNPIDIPEFEERVFINVYNFSVKVDYYMQKRSRAGYITNIDVNMFVGNNVVQIHKEWSDQQQKIITKFNEYIAVSTLANPYIQPSADDLLTAAAISALGQSHVMASINVSGDMELSVPSLSASPYENLFYIYYRLDNSMDINRYTAPININFQKIYFWLVYSPNTSSAAEFEVRSYEVI